LAGALEHGLGSFARNIANRVTADAMLELVGGAEVVVSTYPGASQVLGYLRRTGRLTVPVVTYLTDMSVHRLWVADGIDMHLALHPIPAGEAMRLGARVRVVRPAVRPEFEVTQSESARHAVRQNLGLPDEERLALVVAGSWGVGQVAATMRDIARSEVAVPVAVCGTNERLMRRLAHRGDGVALGWVDDMAGLMGASDMVIQNAGGLSSLEALAAGRPVVSYRCIPGHGIINARNLEAAGLAGWARSRLDLADTMSKALANGCPLPMDGDDPAEVIESMVRRRSRHAALRISRPRRAATMASVVRRVASVAR
jgi:UDP-N-acetylglucosamine:LPS N-acetylglucosamine transferase